MAETFFISYTGQDEEWATWIAGKLIKHGYETRIQAWDIRAGDNFVAKMDEYVRECDACIPVLSRAYFDSAFCREEWTNVYAAAMKEMNKRLIPVRISDVLPGGLFRALVYIDLYRPGVRDDAVLEQKLIDGIKNDKTRAASGLPPASEMFLNILPPNNLPERNIYFSGRETQLDEIHTRFKSGAIRQTITGLGGVGKTQTAVEYAWRHIGEYPDAVWFVNAETDVTVYNDCLGFARMAGLVIESADGAPELTPKQLAEYLGAWFSSRGAWLVIFDNAEQNAVIAPYAAKLQTGHILITTRGDDMTRGKSTDVGLFTPGEAKHFINERLSDNAGLIADETALDTLIERMDRFPLALEQAAAYMESAGRNCPDYLALLDRYGAKKTLGAKKSAPKNYHSALTDTLSLSIGKLGESAGQLFSLCAYMAPDAIPTAFFVRRRGWLPEPLKTDLENEIARDETIAELLNFSLAKGGGHYLGVHRLVQEITRERENGTDWLDICADALVNDLPSANDLSLAEKRGQFDKIAVHAETIAQAALTKYAGDAERENRTALLFNCLGLGHNAFARYGQAHACYLKAASVYEKILGENHLSTAVIYFNVGYNCASRGDYGGALKWYDKCLAVRGTFLNENHPDIAAVYSNIAYICSSRGDHRGALDYYLKVLAAFENGLGSGHPDTAVIRNNLAAVYMNLGDYGNAAGHCAAALSVYKKTLGPNHPTTAIAYNNLAVLYEKQGDRDNALACYEQALAIQEAVLGDSHPATAVTYNNMAVIHNNRGAYGKALELYHRVIEIRRNALGAEHPETADAYGCIAAVYHNAGDYPNALEWYKKALPVLGHVWGNDHPKTLEAKQNMEIAYGGLNTGEPFETWLDNNLPAGA